MAGLTPDDLFRVLEFAARAHAGHFRKSTRIPYLVHPVGVSQLLMEEGCTPELAAAALLHDTVEDCGIGYDQLEAEFGPRVAELVRLASEPDKSLAWEERKRHTLELLQRLEDEEALLLILADKLDNLSSVRRSLHRHGPDVWNRFNRGAEPQRWYFGQLVEVLGRRLPDHPLLLLLKEQFRAVFPSE